MKPMKKARMPLEALGWLVFALLLALIILVFIIWRAKGGMTKVVEQIFDFLRFGT